MVRFLSSAAAAAVLLGTASASPVASEPIAKKLIGFNEDFVQSLTSDDLIPEVTVIEDSFVLNTTVSEPKILGEVDIEALQKRFINGADDRFQFTNRDYPWVAAGKLQWSNGVFCSGALVGPRHVLTAKHCIVNGQTGTFSPMFDNGAPFGSGRVTNIVTSGYEWGTPCGWKGDWAVLILDNRLGDQIGYMGVKLPDPNKQNIPMFDHIGYPGDRDGGNRPYRVAGNTVQSFRRWDCDNTGPFYTDTDCAGGQSGGPHWEWDNGPYIWGTLSVTFDGGNGVAWSGWGSGNEMLDAVNRLRGQFP